MNLYYYFLCIYCCHYINNIYYGDYSSIEDVDILCITAGMPQGSTKTSRMEDIAGANKIIDSIMEKINSTKSTDLYYDKLPYEYFIDYGSEGIS